MFRKVNERKRTYVYNGFKLTYENVIEVKISESGTHYLNLKDGKKVIVAPKWLTIELDMDEWDFTSSK